MINVATTIRGAARTSAALAQWRMKLPKAIKTNMYRQALRLRVIMVRGIRDQAPGGKPFKPLADSTKEMKGSSKALIDHGDLIRSIGVDEHGGGEIFFIGVNRNAQKDDGASLYNLAEIHNDGTAPYTIPVTPALRRFWMAMFMKGVFKAPLRGDVRVLNHPGIPARPFIEPSQEEWAKDVERQFTEGLSAALGVGGF